MTQVLQQQPQIAPAELTVPKKAKKMASPFTIASVKSIGKENECSISGAIPKTLLEFLPRFLDYLPKDHQLKLTKKEGKKSVQCSKVWFNYTLGQKGYSKSERETVRVNVQVNYQLVKIIFKTFLYRTK